MKKKRGVFLLIGLVLVFLIVNYNFLDTALQGLFIENEVHNVIRVIDGDTIEIENKTSVRLLGINTPERGERYYYEAKSFLESKILKKEVMLKFVGDRYDKYGRLLAYVFLGKENVNVGIVEQGFGNYYFYSDKDRYSKQLIQAWNDCIESEINLCEKSGDECASCILIDDDSVKNNCGFNCNINDWEIKGEGRDKIVFSEILRPGEEVEFDSKELTENTGGSLFLRDGDGKLVEFNLPL